MTPNTNIKSKREELNPDKQSTKFNRNNMSKSFKEEHPLGAYCVDETEGEESRFIDSVDSIPERGHQKNS
jgi:hypothetical protein